MPSLFLLLPLFGLIILNIPRGEVWTKIAFWFAAVLFTAQAALAIFHHPALASLVWGSYDPFFKVNFTLDHLTFIMLIAISIVLLASLLVARYTIFDAKDRFKFINLLMVMSIGLTGVVMVKDLFTTYIFIEIVAVTSFIMIAFERGIEALEGSFKYLIMSTVATVMMLTSIALMMLLAEGTSFEHLARALHSSAGMPVARIAIALFISGLLIKGGLVPFHGWVPDAYMVSPPAAAVVLAGIVTKTAGVYVLLRVIGSIFGFTPVTSQLLLVVGTLSILFGALCAMRQADFNRMLAYSSISQVGYILVGFAVATPLGIAGAVFHLFNHSIFKSLLFVNSAALQSQVGTRDMNRMGGLSTRMPVTGVTSAIGMLSASGIPPFAGFWSKLMIVVALWQTGHTGYCIIAVMASVLTLGYLLIMQRKVFFGVVKEGLESIHEARFGMSLAASALAAITIGVGLSFPFLYANFLAPLGEVILK